MLERAFKYGYQDRQWIECRQAEEISADIEKLDFCLFVHGPEEETERGKAVMFAAYCRGGRVTACASGKAGAISPAHAAWPGLAMEVYTDGMTAAVFPVRWRIFQRDVYSPLNVAVDLCTIGAPIETGRHYVWRVNAGNFDLARRRVRFVRGRERGKFGYAEAETYIRDMPPIVADAAIEAMQANLRLRYGINGGLLSRMAGYTKLMAYWERPFDLHIVYLKQFIGKDFAALFPYEEKNCYARLCRYLGIQPPKSVRKAYTYNPYAILWYLFFQEWGILDANLLQPFLRLDDCIANFALGKFVYDKEKQRILRRGSEHGRLWQAMEWYLLWLKEKRGTKYFCRQLYRLTVDPLRRWQMDTLAGFYEYYGRMPAILRETVLQDGFTAEIHEAVREEINAATRQEQDVSITYPANLLALECQISGFQFRLVHETKSFRYIGIRMHSCVASYWQRVLDGDSTIATVTESGKYTACIELDAGRSIVQALGCCNEPLTGRCLQVCRYWARKMQLSIATDQLARGSCADLTDCRVEALPDRDVGEGQRDAVDSWQEFAKRIENETGFFVAASKASRQAAHVIQPPPWKRFNSEKDYISYVFPGGKPMYAAAAAGDHEAQLGLAILYGYGKAIALNPERAGYWAQLATGLHRGIPKRYQDECLMLALARAKMRVEACTDIKTEGWQYRMPVYRHRRHPAAGLCFSDIVSLEPKSMQLLIREAGQKELALAMAGADEGVASVVYENMSCRAEAWIREEIAFLQKCGVGQRRFKEAQQKITNTLRSLEDKGEILLCIP